MRITMAATPAIASPFRSISNLKHGLHDVRFRISCWQLLSCVHYSNVLFFVRLSPIKVGPMGQINVDPHSYIVQSGKGAAPFTTRCLSRTNPSWLSGLVTGRDFKFCQLWWKRDTFWNPEDVLQFSSNSAQLSLFQIPLHTIEKAIKI